MQKSSRLRHLCRLSALAEAQANVRLRLPKSVRWLYLLNSLCLVVSDMELLGSECEVGLVPLVAILPLLCASLVAVDSAAGFAKDRLNFFEVDSGPL